MAPSTGNAYMDELLAYLHTLPVVVNPYTAAIAWLAEKVSPPAFDDSYQQLTIAFACIYALQFLTLATATIILPAGQGNWIIRWTPDGLWQPNPKLPSAFFCAAFCGCHTATLICQALINAGKIDHHNHIALQGMRWIPLLVGGWLFVHACLRNIVVTRRKIGLFMALGSEYTGMSMLRLRISSEWPIWALNILGAAFPIAEITVECIAFASSNKYQNRLIDRSRSLAVQFATAARAHQSATFQPQDLLPFSDTIREIERAQSDMALWWRIGTGSLGVSLSFIMIIFIPFFVRHLALFKGLMRARSFWRAFMLDFASVPATLSVRPVASRPQREGGFDGPPVLPSIDVLLKQQNVSLSTGRSSGELWPSIKPAAPKRSQPRQRDPKDVDLRAEYRRLILSGLALWMGELAYVPIAIWATVASLENAAFYKGELWLTNIVYFPTVLVVNVFFNYIPAWRQIRGWIQQSHRR